MRHHRFLVSIGSLLALTGAAQAGTLFLGHTVSIEHDYPTLGSVNWGPQTNVVGAGLEFVYQASQYTVDVSDTNILVDINITGNTLTGTFNGLVITDILGTIPDFTSVTINAATNLVGFDSSRVSFTANQILINWRGGLQFTPSTVISLDVTGPNVVPLPSAAWMGLSLLGAFGLVGRCRDSQRRTA